MNKRLFLISAFLASTIVINNVFGANLGENPTAENHEMDHENIDKKVYQEDKHLSSSTSDKKDLSDKSVDTGNICVTELQNILYESLLEINGLIHTAFIVKFDPFCMVKMPNNRMKGFLDGVFHILNTFPNWKFENVHSLQKFAVTFYTYNSACNLITEERLSDITKKSLIELLPVIRSIIKKDNHFCGSKASNHKKSARDILSRISSIINNDPDWTFGDSNTFKCFIRALYDCNGALNPMTCEKIMNKRLSGMSVDELQKSQKYIKNFKDKYAELSRKIKTMKRVI